MNEHAQNTEKKKILLVEDEAIIAMDQARTIEQFGYEVVTAVTGTEAVETVDSDNEIQLVLMDIDLGSEIDGTEAARRILEIRQLPIVFLTSHAEKEMVDRVKNITRYGYVLKNSGKFVLNEAITMAFELFDAHRTAQRHREEIEVTNEELRAAIEEMEATNEEFEAANEELLNSEKELWESREKFRELFENMGNGVAVYEAVNDGADFVIQDFNKAAERIENVHGEEVIGRSVHDAFPGVKDFGLFEVFQRVWKTGQPERFPVSQYRDGRISGWRDNFVYRLPSGELVAVYEDVTPGKQAEEQLIHQQQMTEHVIAVSPVPITVIDAEGTIIYANDRAEKVLGLEKSEITSRSYNSPQWDITDLDGNPFPVDQLPFSIVKSTEKPVNGIRHAIQWPDGRTIMLSINAVPLYNATGDFNGMVASLEDITERKGAEEKLHNKERINEKLLTASRYVLEIEDFALAARHVFDASCQITGATSGYVALMDDTGTENELLFLESGGTECSVDPALPMPIRGLRAKAYETGSAVYHNDFMSSEYMKIMPEGHSPLYNVMFAPLNVYGKTVGIMGIANKPSSFTEEDAKIVAAFSDLAALALRNSRVMNELKQSEKRFRDMARMMPEILFETDMQGTLTFVNQAAFEMTGFDVDDIEEGLNAFEMFIPEERDAAIKRFNRIIEQQKGLPREYTALKKDGTRFPVKVHSVPIVKDARVTGIRGVIVDITHQKRVQEEKQQLVEQKELLLREVHHRIKNDMNVLRSLLSLQSRHTKNSEVSDTLKEATNRIYIMSSIYNTLYRGEDVNSLSVKPFVNDIVEAIRQVYTLSTSVTIEQNIEDITISAKESFTIGIIVNELITNAFKYAFEGYDRGELRVTIENDQGSHLRIEVADNGVGIPAELLDNREFGFGLTLVDALVSQQGGTVHVKNDNGGIVQVIIPLAG